MHIPANKKCSTNVLLIFPLSYKNIISECSLNVQNIQFYFILFIILFYHSTNIMEFWMFSECSETSSLVTFINPSMNVQLKCSTSDL